MTIDPLLNSFRLVALSGPMAGEVLPASGAEVTMGRDPASGICVADRSLSRTHCALALETDGWVIRDLGSANGTFVNGIQVQQQALRDGDQIRAGESVFLLCLRPQAAASAGVQLVAEAPSMSTSRLRLEDSQYLNPTAQASSTDSPHVEHHLRALLKLSTALGTIRDEAELFEHVLDHTFGAVPADAGALALVDARGEMSSSHSRRRSGEGAVPVSRTVLTHVIRERVGILSRDTSVSQSFRGAASLVAAHVRSLLCVPLAARGRTLGALYLTAGDGPGTFDDNHLELVTAIGAITSIALDNVRHLTTVEREADRLRADLKLTHSLVGKSEPIQRVYERVEKIARTNTTTLIYGETGTGKELVARTLHLNSDRARAPFLAINCAALTPTLLETELFGYERGAFTDAYALKKGKLEVADGGTVFLDEVSELAPLLQGKLLRVLQQREFERVGGTRTISVNIRIISASNKRLAEEVAAGRFRDDLFFRLNVVSVTLPPLRDRGEDIALLARHFLAQYARKAGRIVHGISAPALQRLMTYPWPGNVRELENAIEHAVVLGSSEVVLPEDLPESLLEVPPVPGRELARFHEAVLETKKRVIVEAFAQARRSYVDTARLLGLHPNYLHRVIRNLGLKSQLEGES
ncbi:MAG: sigma 54-interacting transcriptional regulator [Acidobacteriota bacterium]|nr:sigma 54-interacting transcriptional regulator [Acidobacteriota bacterium]